MDAPITSAPPPSPAAANPLTAWPRSAQLTTAFLLGVVVTLLVIQAVSYSRFGSRPTELERTIHYRIDLNRASRAELLQLPGVGERLAERVEDYRREHGPLQSVDDLGSIHGIGPSTIERLRPWVFVHTDTPEATPPAPKSVIRKSGKKEANLREPIDVNRATTADLQALPGVGPKIAQRIVDERQKRPFKTIEELRRVAGVGPKTLERLKPLVTVSPPAENLARESE